MSYRVAILGAGIGEQHLRGFEALTDRFSVSQICDLNTGLAEQLAARVGAKVTDRIDETLADDDIDIIDVCLPPALHASVVRAALSHGKHVIVEKPITGSLIEADELVAAEMEAVGRIFPVFQYRYGRAIDALKRLEARGLLGVPQVATLETHWSRDADYYAIPWRGTWARELGGAVLSHAIHAHDLLTRAFGPVGEVSAMLATRINPIETEDCASIAFRLANGALATSSITLGAADNTSRLRLIYEHVTVESGREPYAPGMTNWYFQARDSARQSEIDEVVGAVSFGHEGYAGLFAAIADALDGRPGAEVTLADGVASIELVTAIYHAHRTSRAVKLPLDRALPIARTLRPT
ncbi:MAG: Gfo/Idh/MocA family oxidoreductase [Pseudomonadota bacterium]